ncbi:50S ribosomal protein L9 [Salinisphaera hydrothermalis]|uniref:Large ribosomal subunit protein bL9 n=1 Tax=Salinisphaera hydrothermalis (strain C41B8) TaxID=1304275 RepID=A0A084IGZ8_SALHC|nr:50S ribosomal protein L9 [Salinisphaera hydrothermalis]KEZ75982.1 50S ribosomal protein L9 [Salinisphaera hydrothermalis C41B8]
MDVILLQKIRNLGDLGDTVSVRAGYGRNYLFPRGMALPATKSNLAVFEERRAELQAASQEREDRAKLRAGQLRNKSFTIAMRASDEGKLFGSVGPQEIAQAVVDEGHELDPREVTLTEGTIRQTGYYIAELTLHAEVVCEVEIVVAQQTDMGINMPVRVTEDTEADATAEEVEGERVEDAGEPADASATEADAPIGEREEP